MGHVSDKSYRKEQNTHFMFNNFSSENCAVYEIKWKNMVQPDRPKYDNIIHSMHFACWITKATEAKEYVIFVLLLVHCDNGYTDTS
jgi:hypothetical protein